MNTWSRQRWARTTGTSAAWTAKGMEPPDMNTPTTPKTTSFSHRAAKLGWVCPVISLIVFALLIFDRHIVARKIIPIIVQVALLLIVLGLVFSVVALFGVSKHGSKGILVPAIIGIIISGLLILFCVIVA
jgi:hypothetical protein